LNRKRNKKNHPIILVDIKNKDGPNPRLFARFSVFGLMQKQIFLNRDKCKIPISSHSPYDLFSITSYPSSPFFLNSFIG
jgi:hypothetical protein